MKKEKETLHIQYHKKCKWFFLSYEVLLEQWSAKWLPYMFFDPLSKSERSELASTCTSFWNASLCVRAKPYPLRHLIKRFSSLCYATASVRGMPIPRAIAVWAKIWNAS